MVDKIKGAKEVWKLIVSSMDNVYKIDEICKLYEIETRDFVAYIASDKLRQIKWREIMVTLGYEKKVQEQKRKK